MKTIQKILLVVLVCALSLCMCGAKKSTAANPGLAVNKSHTTGTHAELRGSTKKPLTNYSSKIKVKVSTKERAQIEETLEDMSAEIKKLAKVVYREAGAEDLTYQSAVLWCILNRVDSDRYGSTITKVITSPNQFAWIPNTPVYKKSVSIVEDVLIRWLLEKNGHEDVGRTLPNDYFFFAGDGVHNYFRKNFDSTTYWDWSLESPYE